jgi:hypothetical protein
MMNLAELKKIKTRLVEILESSEIKKSNLAPCQNRTSSALSLTNTT